MHLKEQTHSPTTEVSKLASARAGGRKIMHAGVPKKCDKTPKTAALPAQTTNRKTRYAQRACTPSSPSTESTRSTRPSHTTRELRAASRQQVITSRLRSLRQALNRGTSSQHATAGIHQHLRLNARKHAVQISR